MGQAKGYRALVNSTVSPSMSGPADYTATAVFLSTPRASIWQKPTVPCTRTVVPGGGGAWGGVPGGGARWWGTRVHGGMGAGAVPW